MGTLTLTPEQQALLRTITPSATPSEAEIAAWRELPRDEQVRRMRQALTSTEATTPSRTTMAEIWAEIERDTPSYG